MVLGSKTGWLRSQEFKNNNSDNLTKLRTDLDQAFNYGAEKFKETFNHGADRFAVVLARVDISVNSALKKAHLKHTVDNANPMVAVKVCLANVNTSFQDMFQLLQNKTMFSQLIQTANFLKLPGPRKENFLNLSHRIQTEDITDISELGPDGAIVIDIIREVVPLVEPGTGEASALASRILTNVVEPVIHTNILFIAVVIIRAIVIFKSNRFGFKGF
jgi:hypothetical protein